MSDLQTVELGPIAHGGHCVARIDGRVVFVRHGIPGEQARVRVTDDSKPRFWWGEVVQVIEPSPDRVTPPCPIAGRCGGCDFQHVSLARQRRLKAEVVEEQLHRLAGIDRDVVVEQVPGDDEGLDWRTRMRYLVRDGKIGLRAWRSDDLVELPEGGCRIAHPDGPVDLGNYASGDGDLQVTIADGTCTVLGPDGQVLEGSEIVIQHVRGRKYQVRADGFWQVHPGAAGVLTEAVLEGLKPRATERALDLYCGVGLFAGALVDEGCRVTGIEASRSAIELAKLNVPQAKFFATRMEKAGSRLPKKTDLVVLDPPRTGAGAQVVKRLAQLDARAIAYVACDPAALARDLATFAKCGYRLDALQAFDLFPMTHHVECVAILHADA
ncbi:TRAM domain-containing protein [Propionimicrobium sp. PCR01-08-3]|uniref:class I SAM-dependent RNA methyltransferase n=1 Tax=Propionimicrobium sp. PCR01-08-3 TaxID=3052086 RepID=UPI00255C986B|nr:TRAM domain-containing protein [Propionimicrobium sp. PCR01-08-3]WIY81420.1 methyltransferase [Propionimicrobium sp. PCR01-08-3]